MPNESVNSNGDLVYNNMSAYVANSMISCYSPTHIMRLHSHGWSYINYFAHAWELRIRNHTYFTVPAPAQ